MDRSAIGKLLAQYVETVENAPVSWEIHLRIARRLHARWLGGESLAALKAALQVEWQSYTERTTFQDSETFAAFRAFNELCDAAGITLQELVGNTYDRASKIAAITTLKNRVDRGVGV